MSEGLNGRSLATSDLFSIFRSRQSGSGPIWSKCLLIRVQGSLKAEVTVEEKMQMNHSSPPVAVPEGQASADVGTGVAASGVAMAAVPADARVALPYRGRLRLG